MRLIHYSNAHIDAVLTTPQERNTAPAWKPRGLWVTSPGEDDWPSWCRAEDFHTDHLTHATEVILAPTANILHLDGEDVIRGFHALYAQSLDDARPEMAFSHGMAVDWPAVAESYDGILIIPYVWSLRLDRDVKWYYPWDCNSGCIWNARAVAELRPLIPALGTPGRN